MRTPTPTVLPARGKLPLTARLCTIRQHLLAAPRRLPREQAVQAGLPDSRCGRVAARACSRFMSSQYLGRATRARETSCVRFKEPRPLAAFGFTDDLAVILWEECPGPWGVTVDASFAQKECRRTRSPSRASCMRESSVITTRRLPACALQYLCVCQRVRTSTGAWRVSKWKPPKMPGKPLLDVFSPQDAAARAHLWGGTGGSALTGMPAFSGGFRARICRSLMQEKGLPHTGELPSPGRGITATRKLELLGCPELKGEVPFSHSLTDLSALVHVRRCRVQPYDSGVREKREPG